MKSKALKEHKAILETACKEDGHDMDFVNNKIKSIEDKINKLESLMTYKIIRNFFDDEIIPKIIKEGLTLGEAQAHCQDPETSSSTCNEPINLQRTELCGEWFDGYAEEGK